METLYGQSVIRLSDLVDQFCLKQSNRRESDYFQFLVFAKWSWKKLFREAIWNIKSVALEADHHKHTITLPDDCERLVNISVVDRFRKLHPLTPDSDFNTVEVRCQKNKCSCTKCKGENTLCAVMDNISMTTQQIDFNGTFYPLTTWIRYSGNGELQQDQSIPTLDTATDTIVYQRKITTLCNLEIDEKGCIKPTEPNIKYLVDFCGWDGRDSCWNGWGQSYKPYQSLIPAVYNYYGYWKKNAADPQIIHIFRNHYPDHHFEEGRENHHHHEGLGTIIVTYQTNGETPGEEILVPEYAVEAVEMGMIYQQRVYSRRDGDKDDSGFRLWNRAKMDVMKYLNPIRMEVVAKLQTQARQW